MSVTSKRKMELSSAMAVAKNTSNLKRKLIFSRVLAATEAENSSLRSFATNKNKRVTIPGIKNLSKSNASSSFIEQTTNTRDGARGAPREKPQVNLSNTLVEDNTVTDNTEATDEMTDEISDDTINGLNAQKYTRKCGEKPKIIISEGINKPVGEHSSKHAAQIGVLIRLEAPMQVEGWKTISDDKKQDLFRKLTNKLSYEVEKPHVVQCIWKSFAKQYSTFRSNAHKYYQKVKTEGGITLAKQRVYEKRVNRGDDWLWLCDFWETEKFKMQCDIWSELE